MQPNHLRLIQGSRILFFFFLILFFSNCEKDDINPIEVPSNSKENTRDIHIKTVSLSELQQDSLLGLAISKIEKQFDYNKKQDQNNNTAHRNSSITLLTDEILLLNTPSSKAYTFRTASPLHPEADYENFILYKKKGEKPMYYLYSYKKISYKGETRDYVISIRPIEELSLSSNKSLSSRLLMSNGCLWDITESGSGIEISLIWCEGGSGSTGDVGDYGSDPRSSGCGDWVYFNPDGSGKCIRTKSCVDSAGNAYTTTQYNVTCAGNVVNGDDNDGANHGSGEDHGSGYDDIIIDDDLGDSGSGGGGSTGGGSSPGGDGDIIVGTLPKISTTDRLAFKLNFTDHDLRRFLYDSEDLADLLYSLCELNNFSSEAKMATVITLYAAYLNQLSGPFNQDYYSKIAQYLSSVTFTSEIDLTTPKMVDVWEIAFYIKSASLQKANSNDSKEEIFWHTVHDMVKGKGVETFEKIQTFLNQNTSNEAFDFAKWVIQFEVENQNPPHDYKKSLERMAQGLRKFGGSEGALLAEFIDNVTQNILSMTVGEVKDFHALMKDSVNQFNTAMLVAITNAYVRAAIPILEFVLFETGTTLAIKLLSKIPVSWVYRGARLERLVTEAAKMGNSGTSSRIRIISDGSYIKAKEFFNALTKNAVSIKRENLGNGKIRYIADMGNNNSITFRNFDHSGTQNLVGNIDLNFPGIWTRQRELKFIK